MTDATDSGHCLCGAVRFEVSGPPLWVAYCQCNDCRRNTGAAMATFVGVKAERLRWLGDAPAAFASSPCVRRTFCRTCGGALTYEGTRFAGEVHINVGVMDRPAGRLRAQGPCLDQPEARLAAHPRQRPALRSLRQGIRAAELRSGRGELTGARAVSACRYGPTWRHAAWRASEDLHDGGDQSEHRAGKAQPGTWRRPWLVTP